MRSIMQITIWKSAEEYAFRNEPLIGKYCISAMSNKYFQVMFMKSMRDARLERGRGV